MNLQQVCLYGQESFITNLGDMENAYKYFDLTYNELRYTPFSMEDKKYWQFYKQRKEEINPKKKTKK